MSYVGNISKTRKLYLEEAAIRITKNPDNAKQLEFLTCKVPFPLFSGGVGAGKTAAFCWRAIALSTDSSYFGDMSGNVGLLGRYSMTSFKKTTYIELMNWLPRSWIRRYHEKDQILELRNESVIHFTHLDEAEHLHSYNLGWAGIDQLEQIPEEVFKYIAYERIRLTRLDRRDAFGRPVDPPVNLDYQTVFGTCNPKRGWVYDRFIKNEMYKNSPDKKTRKLYNPNYYVINVQTDENARFLPESYLERQKSDLSKREYNRRVLGMWDAFEGQVYTDFSDDLILPQNKAPRPDWKLYVSIDHGGTGAAPSNKSTNMTNVLFMSVKERPGEWPIIHMHDELVLASSTIEQTVARIDDKLKAIATQMRMHYNELCTMIGEHPRVSAWRCDPSMNRRSGDTVETVAEAYMRHAMVRGFQMPLAPGDNSLDSGIEKVSWLFRKKLVLVNPRCRDFAEAHRTYEYGKNDRPAKNQNDHSPDNFRYICSAIPLWWGDFALPTDSESIAAKHIRHLEEMNMAQNTKPIYGL